MAVLQKFSIRRIDSSPWRYVVDIATEDGATLQLDASFDDLDQIAAAIDKEMAAVVEAAERKIMGR